MATISQAPFFPEQYISMENKLIKYFSRISDLSPAEQNALEASMVVQKFNKDDFLLKTGQRNLNSFFVMTGCVRQFKLVEGEEITTGFFTDEQWIISLDELAQNPASTHCLVCLEDTTVVVGNEESAQKLFRQHPRFETIARNILQAVLVEQQQAMSDHLSDTPEQRYLGLLKSRPDLFQRVPQYHIATYIGVKPESLSRIRKRLWDKK
jgi:CRP-like cAMP-binding protein